MKLLIGSYRGCGAKYIDKMNSAIEKKVKTVVFFCTGLHALGGTCHHLLKLYKNMSGRYRILIVYCSKKNGLLADFFIRGGVKKENLFFLPTYKALAFIPLVEGLRKILVKEKAGILHTFFLHSDVIGYCAGRLAGVKVLISSVEGKFLWGKLEGVNKIKQACYKLANFIIRPHFYKTITVSQDLIEELLSYRKVPDNKLAIIKVGIDIPLDDEVAADFCSEKKEILIGSAARFSKDKGLHYLIEAIPYVTAQIPRARFVIAGRGPEEKYLKQRAAELNIQPYLVFSDWIKDIKFFLKKIDIIAVPSIREGCPASLLEALSFKKPAVAFAIPGIKEIISNGESGILVEPFDVRQFAKAIIGLCEDWRYAQSLGAKGRKLVQGNYSIAKEAVEIQKIYSDGLRS